LPFLLPWLVLVAMGLFCCSIQRTKRGYSCEPPLITKLIPYSVTCSFATFFMSCMLSAGFAKFFQG
jgi:hypothetical protein